MSIDTDELDYIVRKILSNYPTEKRWPINIIDQVFAEIERSRFVFLPQYHRIIGKDGEHKHAVNPYIGKLVKDHTRLETIREGVKAELSTLIDTYSELGPTTNGKN